ncbi:MAG: phosphoribosyl-ATP diphosphatase [Clostridiales bacterium]|nr:phosphoribosyl-ATP diphosphatase [Clostridiales bacterium]
MRDEFRLQYEAAMERRSHPAEGSYTRYLFDQGTDKILKKIGEECAETIIAAKGGDHSGTIYEIADLLYHIAVLMVNEGITIDEVYGELNERSKKSGNLKEMKTVDKNT